MDEAQYSFQFMDEAGNAMLKPIILQGGLGNLRIDVSPPEKCQPLELWADIAISKIISVGDNAPEPIKQQALAVRDAIYKVVLDAVRSAANDRRFRDAYIAQKKDSEIANMIRED